MNHNLTQPLSILKLSKSILLPHVTSWPAVTLAAILLGAAGLRLAGIEHGLPLVFFVDEANVVEHALALSLNDFNPHLPQYGSLPLYIFKVCSLVANLGSSLFEGRSLTLPEYYLVARLISAMFGIATVYLAFVVGRLVAGAAAGCLSAALFTTSPLAVELSHYATIDSMLGFWAALALLGLVLWLQGHKNGPYLTGIATGLAMGTKLNAAVLFIPMALTALQWEVGGTSRLLSRFQRTVFNGLVLAGLLIYIGLVLGREPLLSMAALWTPKGYIQPAYIQMFERLLNFYLIGLLSGVGLAVAISKNWPWACHIVSTLTGPGFLKPFLLAWGVFFLVSPFVLLDFPEFARNFFFQLNKTVSGGEVSLDPGSRSYLALVSKAADFERLQFIRAIQKEWGLPVFLTMFVGLGVLWQQRQNRSAFVPFTTLLIFMLVMTTTWRYPATRYLYPIWLLFTTMAGIGLAYLLSRLPARLTSPRLRRAIRLGLVILFLLPPAALSFSQLRYNFLLPDTRTLAADWLEQNVAPEAFILREWDTPEMERLSSTFRVHVTGFPFEEATLAEWKRQGVTIVIISNARYQFYQAHAAAFQDVLAEYHLLKKEGRLLKSFEPNPQVKGPALYIYRLP